MDSVALSIIIPTFNEANTIQSTLDQVSQLKQQGCELIVADGGSTDQTEEIAIGQCDHWVNAKQGRASQMNAGADVASGQWLLFLHADTLLPDNMPAWLLHIQKADCHWGFFTVNLDGSHGMYRCIETMINLRSRISKVATGDQCLFIRRTCFTEQGGFPDIPLMEDVAITKCLRKQSSPLVWKKPVITSSRRWQKNGIFNTIVLMWRLRLAYFLGADPHKLHRQYYG